MNETTSNEFKRCKEEIRRLEALSRESEAVMMCTYLKIPLEKVKAPASLTDEQCFAEGYTIYDGWGAAYKYAAPEMSDEEYRELKTLYSKFKALREKKQAAKDTINRKYTDHSSFSSRCFAFLAWFLWIGGFVASIFQANEKIIVERSSGYSTNFETVTKFNWETFGFFIGLYAVLGIICWCAREVIMTLNEIRDNTGKINEKSE